MQIISLETKEQFDEFVARQKHSQFLQSWEWGEFQKKIGHQVRRYGLYEKNNLKFVLQLVKMDLPLGKAYFYAPRIGIKFLDKEDLNFLFQEIGKVARTNKIVFFRFEPRSEFPISNIQYPISKTIDIQPSQTLILDVSGSEAEILARMSQKTRYNIRLAGKKGVKVRQGSAADFEDFWRLLDKTRERDKFRLHPKNYYRRMLEVSNMKLLIAEYRKKIIAGIIVSYFGDLGVYVHGASANEHRNVMAPYLLQWEAIKIARERGCGFYDFNGIDEAKWPGVTRFKRGFGGEEIKYPGTFDLVFDKKYYLLYKVLRKIRRLV